MNIGIILDNEFNNDYRVRNQVNFLKKHHKVNVLCFGYNGKSYPKIKGINIERIKINIGLKNLFFFLFNRFPIYENIWKHEIKKFIIKNSIETVHCHDLYMSKSTYHAVKLSNNKCKIILDLHENYPEAILSYNWTKGLLRKFISQPNVWKKKEKEYLRYPDKIIVISNFFKNKLLIKYSFLDSKNIMEYPNIIDFRRFEKFKIDKSIKKSKKITLFYFGMVAERRGIFETINSFRNILIKGFNVKLLIIGPTDKADSYKFFELINSSNLKNHIEYIPWIDLSEILTYLKISDICLAPFLKNEQHESGVANKIYQYMFGKKPIIASNCTPQAKLIKSFECGLIFSNQNEFEEKIIIYLKDPNLRKKMGNNGFINLYKKYDSNKFNFSLLNLYN